MSCHYLSIDDEITRIGQVIDALSPKSVSTPLMLWKVTTIVRTVCGTSRKAACAALIRQVCLKDRGMTHVRMLREVNRPLKSLDPDRAPMGFGSLMYILREDNPAEHSRLRQMWALEDAPPEEQMMMEYAFKARPFVPFVLAA